MKWNFGLIFRVSIFMTLAVSLATAAGAAGTVPHEGNDLEMEIIWAQSDGIRHEIFASSYRSGAWEEPVMITDDNAENLHPSIDAGSNGEKWAVWSAVEGAELELRYSMFEDGKWKKALKLPSDLSSNIKPSIIVDGKDIPWVVWSGNNGDLDDIYYSRFVDGKWTQEQRVHAANEVPDILPYLDTDENGFPTVIWDSYIDDSYKKLQSTWNGEEWGEPVLVLTEDGSQDRTAEELDITLPEFITDTRQVFLRVFEKQPQEDK
jgi:hypothetical protein